MNRYRLLPVTGTLALLPLSLGAQEALRTAIGVDRTLSTRPMASAVGEDRMRLGPVQLAVTASVGVEYNDNIRYQANDQLEDVIIRPRLDLGAIWPITESSALSLGMGIGYEKYVDHSQYDSLLLSPDTAITYSLQIKDVILSVYEQAAYSEDVISQPDVVGEARYPRFDNTVGLRAVWSLGDWQLTGGYAHYNFIAFDDDYDYMDRGSEQFLARVGYAFAPETQAGVEFSASLTDYGQPSQDPLLARNDFNTFSAGPFLEWTVFDGLRVDLRGGYVFYSFDDEFPPSLGDVNSFYAGGAINHRLTDYITHQLNASHELEVSVNSDYTERTRLTYSIRWQMTDAIDLSTGVNYDRSNAPDSVPGAGGEDYDRWGWTFAAGWAVTTHLRATVAYNYYDRTSDTAGAVDPADRDYQNHIVGLTLAYRF